MVLMCCFASIYPEKLIVLARIANNLSGQYKRGTGMAIQIGIGNFSGAIAANIYRNQDSPRFLVGREYLSTSVSTGVIY